MVAMTCFTVDSYLAWENGETPNPPPPVERFFGERAPGLEE